MNYIHNIGVKFGFNIFLDSRLREPDFKLIKPTSVRVYKMLKNSLQATKNKH
jgi:hypothetical protein